MSRNDDGQNDNSWEIERVSAKLSKRRQLIEILQVYNEKDHKRLLELTSKN